MADDQFPCRRLAAAYAVVQADLLDVAAPSAQARAGGGAGKVRKAERKWRFSPAPASASKVGIKRMQELE